MDLKDKLRWVLEERGLSQRALAASSGVNLASISQMCSGKLLNPRRDTLENLERSLELPPGFFSRHFDVNGYLRSRGASGFDSFLDKLDRKRGPVDADAVDYLQKVRRRAPDADKLSQRDWEVLYEEHRRSLLKVRKGGR